MESDINFYLNRWELPVLLLWSILHNKLCRDPRGRELSVLWWPPIALWETNSSTVKKRRPHKGNSLWNPQMISNDAVRASHFARHHSNIPQNKQRFGWTILDSKPGGAAATQVTFLSSFAGAKKCGLPIAGKSWTHQNCKQLNWEELCVCPVWYMSSTLQYFFLPAVG